MKRKLFKIFLYVIIISLLVTSVGCNTISGTDPNTEPTTEPTTDPITDPDDCVHNWADATCIAPKSCTKCGETEGDSLGHDLNSDQKCTRCGEDLRYVISYTYAIGTQELGTIWNPHALKTYADKTIFNYITSPLVDISIKDSINGIYQWVYEMATSVKDVTSTHKNDLTKYGVTLPEGVNVNSVESGYVYEIKLNTNAAWENGIKITADDYIYSMEMLLHPKFRNLGATPYYWGDFAIAGASEFYNSNSPIYSVVVPAYSGTESPDYSFDISKNSVYIKLDATNMTFSTYSFETLKNDYGYIRDVKDSEGNITIPGATYFDELKKEANPYGYIEVTDNNIDKVLTVIDQYCNVFGLSVYNDDKTVNENYFKEFLFYFTDTYSESYEYTDTVGCYKVDDYTIVYVCEKQNDIDYFLKFLNSNWLVYKPLYEAGIDKSNELWTTNYGTSLDTTIACGTYKMESLKENEQVTFVQNEYWYGFEKNPDGTPKRDKEGNLISYTGFLVDGQSVRQYATTNVQIEVMDYDAAKFAFIKGELSEWYPSVDDLSQYTESEKLAQVDEAYVMSFFFNTKLDALTYLDSKGENKNSAVLSSYNFRKAFSLALNRTELAMSTPAYKPAFTLMGDVYSYDIINDPMSYYRKSEQAMEAIVDLYGIKYGLETAFSTLEDAYYSITGYNLTEAKKLMKQAHDELVAAGVYNSGEDIEIKIAWSNTALNYDDLRQVEILNKLINASIKDSGFGIITFEAVGFVNNRYNAVPYGEYAMGYGDWGDTTADPFKYMELHCNNYVPVSEGPCWNPHSEKLTINIGGKDVTMTWEKWSQACTTGEYADADFATKLFITATMEKEFLNLYHHIPLYTTTTTHLISYKHENYTHKYNSMYGFGGLRLIFHNYDDTTWVKVVAEEGGVLNYA